MEFTWTMRNGSPLSCQSSRSLRSAGTRQRLSPADARNWRAIGATDDAAGRTIRGLALDGVKGSGEILQTKETRISNANTSALTNARERTTETFALKAS